MQCVNSNFVFKDNTVAEIPLIYVIHLSKMDKKRSNKQLYGQDVTRWQFFVAKAVSVYGFHTL